MQNIDIKCLGLSAAQAQVAEGVAPTGRVAAQYRDGDKVLTETGAVMAADGPALLVGHRAYYPRFGYRPAETFGIVTNLELPADVFMAKGINYCHSCRLCGIWSDMHDLNT